MLETFAALFAGHVAGDYLAQTRKMVETKDNPATLALHVAVVVGCTLIALGFDPTNPTAWLAMGLLTLSHAGMDVIKTHLLPGGRLWPYLADQTVHVVTIIVLAAVFPTLMADGLWGQLGPEVMSGLTIAYLIGAFAVFAVTAGDFAVQLLLAPIVSQGPSGPSRILGSASSIEGTPLAGKYIGRLERGLVFLMVLAGYPAGIAVLVAAKSILRFGEVQKDRPAAEYVIIGTLASVGWGMITALALITILPDTALEAIRTTP